MKHVISCNDISYSAAGKDILKGVTMQIGEGVFLGIIGPNGGGKTTLLKIMLGLTPYSAGSVRIFDEEPGQCRGTGLVGYLPQHLQVDVRFPASALDVALMGAYRRRSFFYSAADRKNAERLLDIMGVLSQKDRLFGSLSGGEQQRVCIARALASGPRLLILDEPSTGIDVVGQEDFYTLLKELRQTMALTIVMTSHDIGAVNAQVDEIACLNTVIHYHGVPGGIESGELMRRLYGKETDIIRHDGVCESCERLR